MPTITFFRQARRDGGVRTGIDIDGRTVLSQFQQGWRAADNDPALLWYVDVRCDGPRLPTDVDHARQRLLRHAGHVVQVLEALADKAPEGLDPSEWPLQTSKRLTGATITVACAAVRRVEAREMAAVLRDVAEHWRERLASLKVQHAA
jgi:hypothetical protein